MTKQSLSRWISGALACAAMIVFSLPLAGADKKYKDDNEYPMLDAASKAMAATDWAKALPALQTWKDKYPDSDWKQDRDFYILRSYLGVQQFDKALSFGSEFIDRDLRSFFPDKAEMGNVAAAYFIVVSAANSLMPKNPTAEQLAIGDKAAHKLKEWIPVYFVPANLPPGQTEQSFDQTKQSMVAAADGFLLLEEVTPGQQAEAKKDYPAAEAAYTKALTDHPDNSWIARRLGSVYNSEQKPFLAMYEFARAAAIDPTLGKTQNGPQFVQSVTHMYTQLHGSADGLNDLMATAKGAPIPAPDFHIKTADEIKADAANEFAKDNPEIARWQGIKGQLTQQGDAFFQTMKGAEVPGLMGTIADAKPACHSKELILYVPSPDNAAKTNEITLKLAAALTGKPEVGSNIKFAAVADSFAPSPFMLTMTIEKDKIEDLKMSACTVAPTHKGTSKKKK